MKIIGLFILTFGLASIVAMTQTRSKPIVFTHATVIDATGADAQSDMVVIVTGETITEVGKFGKIEFPKNSQVIDATGKFLIPGLWDMHVHLTKAGENTLPLFIANGVTSVRDMGGDYVEVLKWRKEAADGTRLAPRIKTSGALLESAENVARMKREGTVEPVDKYRIGIATPEEARKAVDLMASLGVDFIKFRTTASPETYKAIAEESKAKGLMFVGHQFGSPETMVDAGQKSIEHYIYPPIITNPKHAEIYRKMSESGVHVVPTIVVADKSLLVSCDDAKTIFEDINGKVDFRRKYLSGYLIADWKIQLEEKKQPSPFELAKLKEVLIKDLQEMRKAGVRLMPGTDVAVLLIYPGYSLHDELQLLVKYVGLTPMEAIISATRYPAEFFGMQNRLGTIEKGKIADLVLLDANPLDDISNTKRIAAVVLNGRYLSKESRERMLADVEAAANRRAGGADKPGKGSKDGSVN
jgi:imidazolonepropionase-like amidohydrolase